MCPVVSRVGEARAVDDRLGAPGDTKACDCSPPLCGVVEKVGERRREGGVEGAEYNA